MTARSHARLPDDAAVKRFKTARHVSMIIGLALAAAAVGAMSGALIWQPKPASQQAASKKALTHEAMTLRRIATFAVNSVPDSVQVDPHGKIVVAVTGYSHVSAWSTSNLRQYSGFAAIPDGILADSRYLISPMFSPDGKNFSVIEHGGGSQVADVWNMATGQATSVPLITDSPTESPESATPGPDGLIAESYSNGLLDLANATTGQLSAVVPVNRTAGLGFQMGEPIFSPDGKIVAVSDDFGMVYLVDVPAKQLVAALTTEKIYNASANGMIGSLFIDSITFSPDSKIVACGSETGVIHVWDVATGRSISTFNVNDSSTSGAAAARPIKTLVFSPDGKALVTADNADATLAMWDLASGRKVATLNAGTGNVASAAFTADGNLTVATIDGTSGHQIEIWATAQKS